MLFYSEDKEAPSASVHNTDTGITYTLEVMTFSGEKKPVVTMMTPEMKTPGGVGKRLYRGDQALEFWRALLYLNPWGCGAGAAHTFMNAMAGETAAGQPEAESEDPF